MSAAPLATAYGGYGGYGSYGGYGYGHAAPLAYSHGYAAHAAPLAYSAPIVKTVAPVAYAAPIVKHALPVATSYANTYKVSLNQEKKSGSSLNTSLSFFFSLN